MGLAYLFALVVGLGILLVQSLMGSKEAGDHGGDHGELHGDADHGELHGDAHADHGELHGDAHVDHGELHGDAHVDHGELHGDAHVDHGDAHAGAHAGDKEIHAEGGLAALFLSTRFWIFAFLGFGLSGTLLHYLFGVSSVLLSALPAALAGVGSGLAAALAFRALRRTASAPAANVQSAVGQVGRVLVPVSKDGVGQIRILLDGQTVDLLAKTGEAELARGDQVVIEEMNGDVAQVSKAPPEL